MSIAWQQSEPTPALLVHPQGAVSIDEAHAAIEQWEHYSRKRLDQAQRLAVEQMMAEDAGGRWAARTTGRAVSRQNGKGDELEVVESWGITQRAEAIVHTAHEIPTAKSAHARMVALMEGHRDLRRKLKPTRTHGITYGNGNYTIELANGGIMVYRTRTGGGGRGLDDISRLVVDEAQHAQPEQLASSTPILAANPNPQVNFVGTGGIDVVSAWWWSMRRRALEAIAGKAEAGRFAWLEHSAEQVSLDADGAVVSVRPDPSDRAAWLLANPGHPARIEAGFLEEQLKILGPELFAREHLCVWDPEPVLIGSVISPTAWASRLHRESTARPGLTAFAFDVTPDRSAGSIGVSDGRHGEVVRNDLGTAWMVDHLVGLHERHPDAPIGCDPGGPAGSLLGDLEAAGVPVVTVTPREHAQACGSLFDAITEELEPGEAPRFVHIGQPSLDAAVEGARKRDAGNAGLWLWDRKSSAVDISPLVAVTIARSLAPSDSYDVLDSVL